MKEKRVVLYARIREEDNKWLETEAKRQRISKNDVVQMLVNKAKESEAARQQSTGTG